MRRLRRARPEVPTVCVSIYPPTPDVRALGCVVHLLKPFSLGEREEALEQALLGAPARETAPAR